MATKDDLMIHGTTKKINAFSFLSSFNTSDRLNLTTQAARDAADPTFIGYEKAAKVTEKAKGEKEGKNKRGLTDLGHL